MPSYLDYAKLPTTAYAEALSRSSFMDYGIKALWPGMPRFAGPAFTVQLPAGDNLMLHAAIYEAPPGSVIVCNAGDADYAVAGGNVCAIAKHRGVAGFIIDGVIRDIGEIAEMQFPVFARGVVPVPGGKQQITPLNRSIQCGGATVQGDDVVIADEDGVVVLPAKKAAEFYAIAERRLANDQSMTLDEWKKQHHAKIMMLLEKGNV